LSREKTVEIILEKVEKSKERSIRSLMPHHKLRPSFLCELYIDQTGVGRKEVGMAIKWITALILFFHPEDSCWLTNDKSIKKRVFESVKEKPNFSVRALFWLLISILVGFTIAQLC
jgi:hypothetical protein